MDANGDEPQRLTIKARPPVAFEIGSGDADEGCFSCLFVLECGLQSIAFAYNERKHSSD